MNVFLNSGCFNVTGIVKMLSKLLLVILIADVAAAATLFRLERSFVHALAADVPEGKNDFEQIKFVTNRVHEDVYPRLNKLKIRGEWSMLIPDISPPLAMSVFGQGACGHISFLFIEVLETFGYEARPVQILGSDGLNKHVVVEAIAGRDTLFIDPLYNWVYVDEDGIAANRKRLLNDWSALAELAPNSGIKRFPVQFGIRYTNWSVLGPLGIKFKDSLRRVFGKEAVENFSFRAVVPNSYIVRMIMSFLLCLALQGTLCLDNRWAREKT